MERPTLDILIVAGSDSEARFAARVLEDHGDQFEIAAGVPDALTRVARKSFDVALVSLSLPRGDGLALVHHLRALHSDVDVLVMSSPADLQETAHALALGVLASVVMPLTGDGLLVAVDRARERRVLLRERRRLTTEEAESRRRSATYARCAAFIVETDATAVATGILDACASELDAMNGAAFLPEQLSGKRFLRVATIGDPDATPVELDAEDLSHLDPTTPYELRGTSARIVAMGDSEVLAVVELTGVGSSGEEARESLDVVTALGTAALSAARKVESIARTGIKDPETSAYTFAYFGDVAGREIDRAQRHGRRFSLLTVSLEGLTTARRLLGADDMIRLRRTLADALLEAVRDSDVVARVEDDELYVLLPETGLLGALTCRRRISGSLAAIEQLSELDGLDPVVGIAVYPSDGLDLGRLLRAARRRAEASRRGVFRRLDLAKAPFWTSVDRLLGSEDDAGIGPDGRVSLHADLRKAHDDNDLARHAAVPVNLLPQLGGAIASDAIRYGLAGSLYVAGDEALAAAVGRAVDVAERPGLRAWSLGNRVGPLDAVSRIHLAVDDPRLDERVIMLALTDLGGYTLLGRPLSTGTMLIYHAADLDLVDGLTNALQSAYHLQPEVR
jgi:diguanylate cyclase (GGDEF)-like protein